MSRQTSRKEEHLEAFRGTVESLTNTYDVGQEKLTALLNELDTLKDDIAELREKGEEMVGLTTASALASVFQQTSGDLLGQLQSARIWFYGSLVVLFGAALFVFLAGPRIGLPPPGVDPVLPNEFFTQLIQFLASLSARLVIMLPAFLLVGFTGRRHRSLFRLRELYVYKHTIAASVAGFKIEAPEHAEAVAAAAYDELLFNPAAYMEKSEPPARKEGPLSGWLKQIVRSGPGGKV